MMASKQGARNAAPRARGLTGVVAAAVLFVAYYWWTQRETTVLVPRDVRVTYAGSAATLAYSEPLPIAEEDGGEAMEHLEEQAMEQLAGTEEGGTEGLTDTFAYPVVPDPEFVYGGTWAPNRAEAVLTTPPMAGSHAATLLHLPGGRVLMAWFGGSYEGAEDVAIWSAVREAGAGWGPPTVAAKLQRTVKYNGAGLKFGGPYKEPEPKRLGREPHWNPVLWCGDRGAGSAGPCEGPVVLFFKVGWKIPSWETWTVRSLDGGATWQEPAPLGAEEFRLGGRGPVKNKPLLMADGRWAAPASLESAAVKCPKVRRLMPMPPAKPCKARQREWKAFVDFSADGGKKWSMGPVLSVPGGGYGVIQPTLWESGPGELHMLLRGRDWGGRDRNNPVWRADSHDGGQTWSQLYRTELRNGNSGLDLAQMPLSKTLVLASNPTSNGTQRWPLQLSVSQDNGATWQVGLDVEVEQGLMKEQGHEYSYPACVAWPLPPGADESQEGLSVAYTWHRKRMAYLSMPLSELLARAVPNPYRIRLR